MKALLIGIWVAIGIFSAAEAQTWPSRTVKIILPHAAGGGADAVARVLGQQLSATFSQRFIVENRPGASGMIGAAVVAKAEPDGYTLMVGSPAETALNQTLFKDMTYDPLTELAPITLIAWTPMVLAAHPSFEASNTTELLALAKARPGAINYSTPGVGSSHHFTGEFIRFTQNVNITHVPYRGAAPAVTDALGGQVKLTISGMPPVVPHLQSGGLKAIAVTSKKRAAAYPDIPALAETKGLEDCDFTNWFGLFAPAGTSPDIIKKLHEASVKALKDPAVRKLIGNQAAEPVGNTPEEFRTYIHAEAAKYGKLVELTGIKVK